MFTKGGESMKKRQLVTFEVDTDLVKEFDSFLDDYISRSKQMRALMTLFVRKNKKKKKA